MCQALQFIFGAYAAGSESLSCEPRTTVCADMVEVQRTNIV
jgi:hypothetical protein